MVNGFTAVAYDVADAGLPDLDDPEATFSFRPAKLAGVPHAGMLSTPAFNARSWSR